MLVDAGCPGETQLVGTWHPSQGAGQGNGTEAAPHGPARTAPAGGNR